jgi:hypothetical protein
MTCENTRPVELDELVEEHAKLRHILEEIQETFQQRQASSRTVVGLLRELKQHVAAHFQHEETEGYFTDAVAAAPRLKSLAESLLQQHPQLLQMLGDLLKLAELGQPSFQWWQELGTDFDAFARCFHDHERGENSLIHEAFQRDLGTDD